jgi:hypothetical protein
MKRLAGIAFGLTLLMPMLQYQVNLFDRVNVALDGGPTLSASELHPPVDVTHALDKISAQLHLDRLVD